MAAAAIVLTTIPEARLRRTLIGSSRVMQRVWDDVQTVARTDAAVLIQGETGTGKELVARAIHEESLRKRGPYLTLNCAAIPSALLESEIFGHERGAFTGAVAQTTGRFQLAHQGTLFLDEIGDMPLDMQPKLLRVLEQQEFERVGSTRTIHVDVRIVAATNRDLLQMVRDKQFRADLYYRLNVFPISIPPLRDRREDIPALVTHFVQKFAARMGKAVEHVPDEAMEMMQANDWPGNVRELENFIERAVIMSSGAVLRVPSGESRRVGNPMEHPVDHSLAEAERVHILGVLRQSGGIVGGRNGAAAKLGLPRTTLLYRMQKLGIGNPVAGNSPVPMEHASVGHNGG